MDYKNRCEGSNKAEDIFLGEQKDKFAVIKYPKNVKSNLVTTTHCNAKLIIPLIIE